MLELKMESCFTFKKVADALKDFNTQITFSVDSRGIRSSIPDQCHSAAACLFIPSSDFTEYRCDSEYEFTLKTDLLCDSLKNSDEDENFTIRMENPNSDRIRFEFNNTKNGKSRKISTRLLNAEIPFVMREDIQYRSVVQMKSSELQKEMSRFHDCDYVRIRTCLEGVTFSGQNDQQQIETKFPPDDSGLNSSVSIQQRSEVDAQFSVKSLMTFAKTKGLSEMVEIRFSSDGVRVKFEIGKDGGFIKFYISPKIGDDDDFEIE